MVDRCLMCVCPWSGTRQAFKQLDMEGDGEIDVVQLRKTLAAYPQEGPLTDISTMVTAMRRCSLAPGEYWVVFTLSPPGGAAWLVALNSLQCGQVDCVGLSEIMEMDVILDCLLKNSHMISSGSLAVLHL